MQAAKTKPDPNTFVPPAVRRQAEAAERAFRAARGEQPTPETPAPVEEAPQQPAPVEQPQPAAPPEQPQFAQGGQVTSEVTPQGASGVTPASPESDETWERRYRGMEGRYKRAEGDIRAMSEQIANLQGLIASANNRVTSSTPQELRPQSLLTPEEVGEYGTEFLDVVARKAKEELSPEVIALKDKLSRLEKQFEGTAQQNAAQAQARMDAALDQQIPQWRDINYMEEFKQWLALPDMYSGAIRHDLLRQAYAQNNTPRVLAFFKGFLDQEAALVPQGDQPHQAGNGKIPLETFAAPGRAKTSAASGAPVEKPVFTHAQVSQFYAESAAGKWRGREAEKDRIEAMIFDAVREGRIR
jgi:hypothetical protein